MGTLSAIWAALASSWFVLCVSKKPHIIWFVADDLGYDDVPFTGHGSEIKTPVLSKLAKEGIVLDNYYVNAICTPTRASFMTGRYPIHLGLQHGVIRDTVPNAVPENVPMVPEVLKAQGYATHAVGKWHLGFYQAKYTPERRGFDTHYGYYTGNAEYWNHTSACWNCGNWTALDLHRSTASEFEPITNASGIYSTNLFTTEIERIIRAHRPSQPLFIYAAYEGVHGASSCYTGPDSPPNCNKPAGDELQAPQEYIDSQGHIKNPFRRTYAAMVGALDEAIGNVTRALERRGMMKDTLILFTTDNGGPDSHFGGQAMSNWPYRGGKGTLFEGGVRAAGLLAGGLVGRLQGQINSELVHAADWLPTFASLAGGDSPSGLDGFDVWPAIMHGAPSPRKEILHNIDPTNEAAALRMGDFKYMVNVKYLKVGPCLHEDTTGCDKNYTTFGSIGDPLAREFLFNIAEDPGEYRNLIADPAHAQDLGRLRARLAEFNRSAMPLRNPDPDPLAKPMKLPELHLCTPAPVDPLDPTKGSKPILCGVYGVWRPWRIDADESILAAYV